MPYCKSCGYKLQDAEDDLHDPKALSDIAKENFPDGNEAEDAHLSVKDGPKGHRFFCNETGEVTTIVGSPPGSEEGEGEGSPSPDAQGPPPKAKEGGVYEFEEDRSPADVLEGVIESPFLGLGKAQLEEVMDWAKDYDGQLPPDMLEDILGNMSGVSKQSAALARQKYEVKMNKLMREQHEDDGAPPIGVTATPPASRGGRRTQSQPQQNQPSPSTERVVKKKEDDGGDSPSKLSEGRAGRSGTTSDLRSMRRRRRIERRNDALDIAAEEAAQEVATEAAGEIAKEFTRFFSIPAKVLESKAQRDPDWFLEKLEQWDIDLDDFMSPSDARKEEMKEDNQGPQVDRQVDEALEQVKTETETNKGGTTEEEGGELLENEQEPDRVEEEQDAGNGEEFDDVFGELEPSTGGVE